VSGWNDEIQLNGEFLTLFGEMWCLKRSDGRLNIREVSGELYEAGLSSCVFLIGVDIEEEERFWKLILIQIV